MQACRYNSKVSEEHTVSIFKAAVSAYGIAGIIFHKDILLNVAHYLNALKQDSFNSEN
jgi:hypothetical protein